MSSTIIGIDLGTTHSLVAVFQGDQPVLIPNSLGQFLTPSVVGFDSQGHLLVGQIAKDYQLTHPESVVSMFKRDMGSSVHYTLGDQKYTPLDLSALLLRQLAADASEFLGSEVEEAVISVPAYFNDHQRQMTKMAGQLAGLKVERIINEPTAAALAYGLEQVTGEHTVMVFDLGGGTLDVSVLSVGSGIFEILATAGDNRLGGEDMTDLLVHRFLDDYGLKPAELSLTALAGIRSGAEQLKVMLNEESTVKLTLNFDELEHLWTFTQARYLELLGPLLERMRTCVHGALHDAGLSAAQVEAVVLAGGATRAVPVRQMLAQVFGKLPLHYVQPDHAIALGAAIQAALKARSESLKDIILTDVCPYTLGVEMVSRGAQGHYREGRYKPVIERNTVIPASREVIGCTIGDNQNKIQVDIYQGEYRLVQQNHLLGSLTVSVPAGPAGQETIKIRFTYDINGILEVLVTVVSTQRTERLVVTQPDCALAPDQIEQRLQELASLKVHPRESHENLAIIARGERMYAQYRGSVREQVHHLLNQFESTIERQDSSEIEHARLNLIAAFNQLEGVA